MGVGTRVVGGSSTRFQEGNMLNARAVGHQRCEYLRMVILDYLRRQIHHLATFRHWARVLMEPHIPEFAMRASQSVRWSSGRLVSACHYDAVRLN